MGQHSTLALVAQMANARSGSDDADGSEKPATPGLLFAYGYQIHPPHTFRGADTDTLFLNEHPYSPTRSSRGESPAIKMSETCRTEHELDARGARDLRPHGRVPARNGDRRRQWSGLAVRAAIALVLALASFAAAGAPDDVDWLATFAPAPGVEVGVGMLVDSTSVWPSTFGQMQKRAIEAGFLQDLVYMFENRGDYLRVTVYVEDGALWRLTPETHTVVFHYPEGDVTSIEYLFFSYDTASLDLARTVSSSRDGAVVDPTARLMRSPTGGFCVYLRFPPGSLPRPKRSWWGGGGNEWDVVPPDSVKVTKGGGER